MLPASTLPPSLHTPSPNNTSPPPHPPSAYYQVVEKLADVHRTREASVTMLLKGMDHDAMEKQRKAAKKTRTPLRWDYFGLAASPGGVVGGAAVGSAESSRVVMVASQGGVVTEDKRIERNLGGAGGGEEKKDEDVDASLGNETGRLRDNTLFVPKPLLKSVKNLTMHRDLFDAHFYVFSHWVRFGWVGVEVGGCVEKAWAGWRGRGRGSKPGCAEGQEGRGDADCGYPVMPYHCHHTL